MSIETDLVAALRADAGVTALVSSGSPLQHRIYPLVAPQAPSTAAQVPYITYQVIVGTAYNVTGGAPCGRRKLIQFDCIADSYGTAKQVAEAIKSALQTERGHLSSEGDDYFPETQNFRVRLDWAEIG